ncbi:unnamed protein product [Rotaria socialis]|uniref:Uncharacterized protein n=1 Tax=Rotaria socialis TaxID=392032 RepID=A0A817QSG2_9BILA|nr:unnamed protein product [Rotaria socialis]
MTSRQKAFDECCLLSHIRLSKERILYLLEYRFKSNSIRTSFDFKSIHPEKPSIKAKISRSLLRCNPNSIKSINNNDENNAFESSDDEMNEISSPKSLTSVNDDDYLNTLAQWDPNAIQTMIESDEEEEEEQVDMRNDVQTTQDNNTNANSMDLSTEMPASQVEDILITFINRSIKNEPMVDDSNDFHCAQLDGQTDFQFDTHHKKQKHKNEHKTTNQVITTVKSQSSKSTQTIELANISQSFNTCQTNNNKKKKSSNQSQQKDDKQSKKFNRPLSKSQNVDENFHPQCKNKHILSSSMGEKSVGRHMNLVQQTLDSCRKLKVNNSNPDFVQPKNLPIDATKNAKSSNSAVKINLKKRKRLDTKVNHKSRTKEYSSSKRKNKLSMGHNGKTILDYFKVIKRSPNNDNIQYFEVVKEPIDSVRSVVHATRKRLASSSDECIVLDDDDDNDNDDNKKINKIDNDDIQLIEESSSSIYDNICAREKLLDHTVDSTVMRVKWLVNLELVLLEHISRYYQQNIRPKNKLQLHDCVSYSSTDNLLSYRISPEFITIIIKNFLKIFIVRNLNTDNNELSLFQYGLTSHLRYLLLELPTYNHQNNSNTEHDCLQCDEYFSLINILFDLLFDLIEYDICEIYDKKTYRSTLIKEDYFNQFIRRKTIQTNNFDRIKLIIYLIELIELHRNKCQSKKEIFHLNQNQNFHSIENFLQHIILKANDLNNERISICLNVMELCLLFVKEKEACIQQMALFLAKLCEENSTYLHLFLFDENLLPDIRLLLISELVWKKFNIKFASTTNIIEFFDHIEAAARLRNPIDDSALLLIRSLFNTYADLMICIKNSTLIKQSLTEQIKMLRNELASIYATLTDISHDLNCNQQIKRTVILFRLLQYKWEQF